MGVLFIIICLAPFIFLGYIMSELDKLLVKSTSKIAEEQKKPIAVVLKGTSLADQMAKLLEEKGIFVLLLTEPFLMKREQNFRFLFALSENDADNIILCKIGKKVYGIDRTISICNDFRNESLFISENILYIKDKHITAQALYKTVLENLEVKR